ncbi:adenylate cyclase [Pseudacidovorax intermedius]|uniref:Adenylate cyclase n=1 Tax=Pseudacidovorax intermedius TaxID=433924 RepID=A0A370FM50_9BURK|nr:CYTH and CHAD domain-containing protein [Pseudacidovorax intermedius]RDI28772.1 adenylate cyclase [Pseudacidovorax intermedius]
METEFKFHIPTERLAAVEVDLRQGAVQRTRMQARYFDTPGGALAAAGMALRLRKEGRRWVQTVKAAGHGLLQRLEHNADLGPARATDLLQPDLLRHQGTPVGERLVQVLQAAGEDLVETYATDIWRLTRDMRHEGARVELALDVGKIVAQAPAGGPMRVAPVCELELELVQGPLAGLVALSRDWAQRHGLWLGTVSKAERGERLMKGIVQVPAVKAETPRFEKDSPPDGAALQRRVIAACLAQILPNASEIAEGSEDKEQIHQLRIGLRRLRTALRELAPLAGGLDPAWEAPLQRAFHALGAQRDRTQVVAESRRWMEGSDAPAMRVPEAKDAPTPADAVREPAFQGVLVALAGRAAEDPAEGVGTLDADATLAHLRHRLRRLHRQSLRDAERFDQLDDDQRHRTRKRLKRLRYLAEFVAPLLDAGRTARYLDQLRPAQDALGLFNDQVTARRLYEEAAEQDAHAWFAIGWLAAQQPRTAKKAGKALRRLADAPKFWKGRRKG